MVEKRRRSFDFQTIQQKAPLRGLLMISAANGFDQFA